MTSSKLISFVTKVAAHLMNFDYKIFMLHSCFPKLVLVVQVTLILLESHRYCMRSHAFLFSVVDAKTIALRRHIYLLNYELEALIYASSVFLQGLQVARYTYFLKRCKLEFSRDWTQTSAAPKVPVPVHKQQLEIRTSVNGKFLQSPDSLFFNLYRWIMFSRKNTKMTCLLYLALFKGIQQVYSFCIHLMI